MAKKTKIEPLHPAEQYCEDVLKGRKVAGEYVIRACERYKRDLKEGHKRGLHFDREAAMEPGEFFERFLVHIKWKKHTGEPFIPEPWEQFILWNVFGWKKEDRTRRFRTVYIEVAKKNGKTTFLGGVGDYLFVCDDEPEAEVYSAATARSQARLVWNVAGAMIRKSRALSKRINLGRVRYVFEDTGAIFEPLGKDKKTEDGRNPSALIVDEFHRFTDRGYFDTLNDSAATREQPLTFVITTAGDYHSRACKDEHDYCVSILENDFTDPDSDSQFAFIACADKEDSITDPKAWEKANPNYGVTLFDDYFERKAKKALRMPSYETSFRRLHLCQWVEEANRWMTADTWKMGATPFDERDLWGRPCFGGLDLARVNDLSAFILVFPPEEEGESVKVVCRFFVPETDIERRSEHDKVPYSHWEREGFLISTPGNITDFNFIEHEIIEMASLFNIQQIYFDRALAFDLVSKLQDQGLLMIEHGQGFYDMPEPVAYAERLILDGQLQHGDHPVLKWCAMNTVMVESPTGGKKPEKAKSKERIDGIVGLVMACRGLLDGVADDPGPSPYETRGVVAV